jgi:low affinity Fe/Cu permease
MPLILGSQVKRGCNMLEQLGSAFTKLGIAAAHPATFFLVIAYACAWLILDPQDFDFHAGAVLATWMMTVFIQRATHRDTQALHGKLDELLRAEGKARTDLADLDREEPEEIEKHRKRTLKRRRKNPNS